MARKEAGQRITHIEWNRHDEAVEAWFRNEAMGSGGAIRPRPMPPERVLVKNNTGADRTKGEVVELGDYLLSDGFPGHFWFGGETPTFTANRTSFGVLLFPSPSNALTECLVLGVCEAKVNVNHEDHQYATLANSSHELTSAVSGPVRIIHKSSGTGSKLCKVLLGEKGPTTLIGKATEAIAVGGSGTCLVYRGIPGSEADTGLEVEAFNRTTAIEPDEWVSLTLVDDRYWYVAPLGCPAED